MNSSPVVGWRFSSALSSTFRASAALPPRVYAARHATTVPSSAAVAIADTVPHQMPYSRIGSCEDELSMAHHRGLEVNSG